MIDRHRQADDDDGDADRESSLRQGLAAPAVFSDGPDSYAIRNRQSSATERTQL